MGKPKTVVIVDDDALICMSLQIMCENIGAEVLGVAGDDAAADRVLRTTSPDFILMDVRLGGRRDGIDVANSHYSNLSETKFIYVTGSGEQETIDRIHQNHPYRILIKPISEVELSAVIS